MTQSQDEIKRPAAVTETFLFVCDMLEIKS